MGFDDELPGRMRTGVDGLQPDVARLVTGGMERGKRFVRRRRIVQAVAAGATLAMLGGVAYAAPWNQDAQLQVANAPAPAQPKPAAKPATKPKQATITPQAALQLLLDQLPAGAKTSDYSGSSYLKREPDGLTPLYVGAYLTYSDSTGAKSLMWVTLDWQEQEEIPACPEPFGAGDWYVCDFEELPGGARLSLKQDREYPASANTEDGKAGPDGRGAKVRSATLLRDDGLLITLWENNSEAEKDAPESRETPPLTLAQLKAIALSPTWQAQLDAEYVKRAEKLFEPSEPEVLDSDPATEKKESEDRSSRK